MPNPSPAFHQLLKKALISLPAWHLLEGLARFGNQKQAMFHLIAETGLDVAQAEKAATALCRRGILTRARTGELSLAPAHADALMEFCDHVEADRELHCAVIKQAARGEFSHEPLERCVRSVTAPRVR